MLNKNTKIWLNYLFGGIISALLLWGIYTQVHKQLSTLNIDTWKHVGPMIYIWACILLMPVNLSLEVRKWHILAGTAAPISYWKALTSFLAGLAFSIVTPNRLGEYPGRILYLKRKNTFRLISVAVLGVFAQLLALMIFGIIALIYYNIAFPGIWEKVVLGLTIIITIGIGVVYHKFENWLPLINRYEWARKFNIYTQLINRFSTKQQLTILCISLLRFAVFTAQYLFFLRWMNVNVPILDGYLLSALFFWVLAVIPSIALAELGIRGQVGLFLFGHFSTNTIGILGATVGLWVLNLIIPSIIGSLLLLRMRILKIN